MSYNYNKIGWENSPSTKTPLNANNLNKMDEAIYSLHTQKQEKLVAGEGIDINPDTNEIKVIGGEGSTVEWNQIQTEGKKIAEVTIDGETTRVFAPEGGASTWSEVSGKPFSSIGTGLTVENDVLKATGGGGADIVELTKAEYDALPDTKLTDGKQYFIKDYSESGSGSVGIITQRITIQNHSGFNPKYDYPSNVNFDDYIILNYHECPPDYAYSRIGHNSLQANEFSSTSDRFFLEMREDGLYVFNNAIFFDGKEIIVIYGKRG